MSAPAGVLSVRPEHVGGLREALEDLAGERRQSSGADRPGLEDIEARLRELEDLGLWVADAAGHALLEEMVERGLAQARGAGTPTESGEQLVERTAVVMAVRWYASLAAAVGLGPQS